MSLASPYQESYFVADGSTVVFPIEFTKVSDDYVKCIIYFENGASCVPSFIVEENNIKIVTLTTPTGEVLTVPPEGSTVRVFRDVPEAQNLTASQLQNFTAKQLEKAFDAIVGMIQENTYTTEHKTIRLTETQRDIYLSVLTELVDGSLLYWDNQSRTIKPTEYPQTDVVRCAGGLFFRVKTRGDINYLEWSINQTDWESLDVRRLNDFMAEAQIELADLDQRVTANASAINAEKDVRRHGDEELRQLILSTTYDVSMFDDRISQNTTDISGLLSRLDSSVTASDKAMPKSYIDGLVSGIYHIKGVKDTVAELPATGNTTGDCWNVLEDGKTYIWTEDEQWVSGAASVDLSPYRTANDQDVIDAGKQDKLTQGTNIEITANNTINMTGKFGKSFSMSGKNLQLKDQDGITLSETAISIGVDSEYTPETEDIKFEESETTDYTFIQEQFDAINGKIPEDASTTNKLATQNDIGTGILTIQKNNETIDTFSANATTNKTISVPVPTTAAEVNALPDTTKYAASIDMSINSDTYVITVQLKDQNGTNIGSAKTVDLPLETVVVSGSYDSTNKKIVLTLKNGSTIDIPVGDLISGLQTEITSASPLDADLVSDTSSTHKFVTTLEKETWTGKQDALVSGTNIKTINSTSLLGSGNIDIDGLPSQADKNGKYLKTNGTTASWEDVDALPSQSGNDGKFLTTNGTAASWAEVDALPSQADQNGKFLTTNGTTASWATVDALPSQADQGGKFLTTDGSAASWATVNALPEQSGQGGKYLKTNGSVASWADIPEADHYIAGDNITIAGVLPDGYTMVEYIESDGTSYIDTGKKWDSNSVIVIKAKGINTTSGSRCIAGAVADGSGFQVVTELNRIGWQIGGAGYTHTSANVADEVRIDVPNHSAYFNGTLISDSYNTTTANINVYLFANNYGGSATSNSHVRVFRYTCYSRYNLPVIDLVPCKNSSNVYGFYDLESDTFFTCNGLTGGDEGKIISANVPEVGNGTVTLKQGGVTKGSFRMNQDNNTNINLDAPGVTASYNAETKTIIFA